MFPKKKTLISMPKKAGKVDIENAADAKKPGDAKEDGKVAAPSKTKKPNQAAVFAKKAATALAKK